MSDYHDIDGNPCTLDALCATEPMWAASRIAIQNVEVKRVRAERDALRAALESQLNVAGRCAVCGMNEPLLHGHTSGCSTGRALSQQPPKVLPKRYDTATDRLKVIIERDK